MNVRTKGGLILASTLVIGIVIGAVSSGLLRDRREHHIQRMPPNNRLLTYMRDVIQPTEEQSEIIDQILAKRSQQLSTVVAEHENEVFAILDSLRTELASVLTDEQRTRLAVSLSRGIQRGYERRISMLAEQLQLTDEQVKQIEQIMANMRHRRPNRRHFGGPPPEFRREMRAWVTTIDERIEEVLTPEQRERFHELRRRREPFIEPPFGRPGPGRQRGRRPPNW